jgi:hypothetical protein
MRSLRAHADDDSSGPVHAVGRKHELIAATVRYEPHEELVVERRERCPEEVRACATAERGARDSGAPRGGAHTGSVPPTSTV